MDAATAAATQALSKHQKRRMKDKNKQAQPANNKFTSNTATGM